MAIKLDMEKAYDRMSCPRPNGRAYFITFSLSNNGEIGLSLQREKSGSAVHHDNFFFSSP